MIEGTSHKTYRIYLIRHGETVANMNGIVLGQTESPLTEKGRSQALLTKMHLNQHQINFWKVYCSDQQRAVDTADLIASNVQLIKDDRLRERAKGVREGMPKEMSREEALSSYLSKTGQISTDISLPFEEDNETVWLRFDSWLKEVVGDEEGDDQKTIKNILVVSHSGTIRIVLNRLKDITGINCIEPIQPTMVIPNCSITIINIDIDLNGQKSIAFDGIVQDSHLES